MILGLNLSRGSRWDSVRSFPDMTFVFGKDIESSLPACSRTAAIRNVQYFRDLGGLLDRHVPLICEKN